MTQTVLRLSVLALLVAAIGGSHTVRAGDGADAAPSEGARVIGWKNLIPPGVEQDVQTGVLSHDMDCLDHEDPDCWDKMERLEKTKGLVVSEFNGQTVTIPGYMVPLDFDQAEVSRFLLVPYAGACIHVPPPPPNQIIFVTADRHVRARDLAVPVIATGYIKAETRATDLAGTGYVMELVRVDDYSGDLLQE